MFHFFLILHFLKFLDFLKILDFNCITNFQLLTYISGNGGCDPEGINTCPYGGVCLPTKDGVGRCHCEDTCPYVVNPVCGSDGKTYDNDCLLKVAGCKRRSPIGIQHSGECGKRF